MFNIKLLIIYHSKTICGNDDIILPSSTITNILYQVSTRNFGIINGDNKSISSNNIDITCDKYMLTFDDSWVKILFDDNKSSKLQVSDDDLPGFAEH